jgi:hypothetical protein
MGIEPTRDALPSLENKRFGAMADAKCDWRVNFRGMWGYLGARRDTSVIEVPRLKPIGRMSLTGQATDFENGRLGAGGSTWSHAFALHGLNHRVPALSKSWAQIYPLARRESLIVSPRRNAANSLSAFRM